MKVCKVCVVKKSLGEYDKDGRTSDGYKLRCRSCLSFDEFRLNDEPKTIPPLTPKKGFRIVSGDEFPNDWLEWSLAAGLATIVLVCWGILK